MNERLKLVSKLLEDRDYRAAYIKAKLDVLIPSQLRALRLRQSKTQPVLADMAGMKQSRISAMETPGKVNFNVDTLVRMAATLKVGLAIEFVPFSEMLSRENEYSQDTFNATQLDDDAEFLQCTATSVTLRRHRHRRKRSPNPGWHFQIATGGALDPRYIPPGAQERYQMRLAFQPLPAQGEAASVIPFTRVGSVSNPSLANAAAVGGIRGYGT